MIGSTVTVLAHAKLNLALHVGEREASGYHKIETVFQRLALADDLTIEVRPPGERSLEVSWTDGTPIDIGPPEKNLAWRAADAFARATSSDIGWRIDLQKRIPVGAGLGGGSSDAAAVLRALNALAQTPLGVEQLTAIGAALGADVAFFVQDWPCALGRGYGEQLEALPALPVAPVLLYVPTFGINTAGAYAALDRWRDRYQIPAPSPLSGADFADWPTAAEHQQNDFESSVFAEHPELELACAHFTASGATIARLSGSGSVVFGVWPPDSPPFVGTSTDLPGQTIKTATK